MVRAAVIQMVSTADVQANLASAEELLARAAADGARLLALPEFFPIISPNGQDKLKIKERYGTGPLQDFLAEQAQKHKAWIIGGSIPIESDEADRVYNSCLLFNEQGACIARYDKIHLFDVYVGTETREQYNESATLKPGEAVTVAHTPFGNLGMSVCYDLRFPELYRAMLGRDISLICVPSAFTYRTGEKHWELLLRARAVENLCYVIAPGQGGKHDETRTTWGHSMIIDPWGDILCCVESGPGFACADLDLEKLVELRKSFPALRHRKIES